MARHSMHEEQRELGYVPTGYADGYPLLLSNRGIVRVGKKLEQAPVIGRINMDQIILDLTDVHEAKIGSEVELISDDPKAAKRNGEIGGDGAQSHPYEMLCRISRPGCHGNI